MEIIPAHLARGPVFAVSADARRAAEVLSVDGCAVAVGGRGHRGFSQNLADAAYVIRFAPPGHDQPAHHKLRECRSRRHKDH